MLAFCAGAVAAPRDGVRLVTTVTNQNYCRDPIYDDDFYVYITLGLTYSNVGQRPIILEKEPNLIEYWRTNETLAGLHSTGYAHESWISAQSDGITESGNMPTDAFVILKPGESYRTETELQISSVRFLIGRKIIARGTQYLEIVIPKWSGTEKQYRFLRDKWRNVGFLWGESARSHPIRLTIDSQPKLGECKRAA
jgi:hypothetical protein